MNTAALFVSLLYGLSLLFMTEAWAGKRCRCRGRYCTSPVAARGSWCLSSSL
jgi:hypothetical protein